MPPPADTLIAVNRIWLLAQTVPDDLREKGAEIVADVQANPALLAILVVIGVVSALIFVFGVAKQLFKAALFAGIASVGAWYWFFNIR